MITITGKIEDATGAVLHATIDFISKSTPLAGSGIVTTNTDARILSNPSDGTFSVPLAAGNYQVTISANGQSTTFTIAVPSGSGTATIDTLVTTPIAYTYVPPTQLWNGLWAGNITFLPLAAPPAPTWSLQTYSGGNINAAGSENYSYWVSYVTATGQTVVSAVLAVNEGPTPTANKANRIFLTPNVSGVTSINIWRTYVDNG
ncbi:MAG TPA: carboxypeptidase-like regulatory domain-containing protein, partial [Verrucomicrobiae bacterium]|nr:carboxypeptidase-like regulatory domain-containing protein [Verrucomicrobiae bacterium]